MSQQKSEATDNQRRQFLKTIGVAGGAVAIAAVAGEAVADVAEETSTEVKSSQGYRETDHVRAYYDSARI
ncbi:MAG: twin-arginine translocation signal domain-containing protein [Motiliproteus sp.]